MVAADHVADEVILEAVVVDVGEIDAHGEAGGVLDHIGGDEGEGAIAVVVIEGIGGPEVVGDVEVEPLVVIDIGEDAGEAPVAADDTGLGGDIGERAVPIVLIEDVTFA